MNHNYLKEIVADRLRVSYGFAIVFTEVTITDEGGSQLARPDIVMVQYALGPEIVALEIKADKSTVTNETFNQMKIYADHANRTYLCLPSQENTSSMMSFCAREGVGFATINIELRVGPMGMLNVQVQPLWNRAPKRWVQLADRLDKAGMPPLYGTNVHTL